MGLRERGGGAPSLVQSPQDLDVTHFGTPHMNLVNTSRAVLKNFPEKLKATVGSVYVHISC